MDTDDSDLVLVGNEPSMSVIHSFPEHPRPLGASDLREFERHTLPITPKSCTGNSGNYMWHAPALNINPDHTQHSKSLQNSNAQPLSERDDNLSSKVKRNDEGASGPEPKLQLAPVAFPQPLELPLRGNDFPRESEDYGAPPPVIPLTPIMKQ